MPVIILEDPEPPNPTYDPSWMKCLAVMPHPAGEEGMKNHVCHERRNHEGLHRCNCKPPAGPFEW